MIWHDDLIGEGAVSRVKPNAVPIDRAEAAGLWRWCGSVVSAADSGLERRHCIKCAAGQIRAAGAVEGRVATCGKGRDAEWRIGHIRRRDNLLTGAGSQVGDLDRDVV